MSDQQPTPSPEPVPVSAPGHPTVPPPAANAPKKTLAILALVFGGVAFLCGVIPSAAGVAWLFAIVGIILAIIAMVKKVPPRWMPPVGLGLAVLGWLIGIIVVVAGIGTALSSISTDTDGSGTGGSAGSSPSADASQSAAPPKNTESAIGETVTNNKKVSFTVNSVTCGLATAGPEFLTETAKGQFCEVKYTVANGGDDQVSLYASDLTGLIGSSTYKSDGSISTFDGDYFSTDLNPGLSASADVFIDIPAGAALNYLVYKPEFSFFTSDIKIKVS